MRIIVKTTVILIAIINCTLVSSSFGSGFDTNQFDGYYFDCAYSVAFVNVAVTGGTISVKAPSGCKWKVTNANNWIGITSGITGDGNGMVTYSISGYDGTNPQKGAITVAGQSIVIVQGDNGTGGGFGGGPGANGSTTTEVPTMTEWGMILFMIIAGIGSLYYLKVIKRI